LCLILDIIEAVDKNYNHLKENEVYEFWEKSESFTPKAAGGKNPFTIIMPPPNANGSLHIGHARFVTIEDVLTRYHRMKGEPTLWLPGADHAGIETQFVFEKELKKEDKSRFDFDRETFYKMLWDFTATNKVNMENQLRALGASCDWTRNTFTLDPKIIKIVYQTFKKLYEDGLVYRGERIVNYCPRCGTAYSQLEVDSVERDDFLYYLDYGLVTIATTRPETIFADVAVAVNPKDKRFKDLIGKNATLPLTNRKILIIADELVDIEFGTGALKITPGHDATDFEIGQKHGLKTIIVIDEKGRMINTPEKYLGQKAEVAREEVIKDLEKEGFLKKTEKLHHVVGVCYKDKGLIEPMISKQWFVKVEPLTKLALEAIKKGEVKFAAKKYEKIAIHWLKNLRDWNISRQIVWGIRIPAWQCSDCKEWTVTEGKKPEKCSKCQGSKLTQDPDTFDTWFSSGQWPFATLKINQKEDFKRFYPTSVMATAYDILPFWVIRMIMLGLYVTKEVPFKEVLLHGLVRDREGQKISKSKGNVINPMEMIEKYGADALRMSLVWGTLIENDMCLSEENIRGQRNFANKLWNIARFMEMFKDEEIIENKYTQENDKLFKNKLSILIENVTKKLNTYKLNEAAETLYEYVWHEIADIYIEEYKEKRCALSTIEYCYETSLKLLHPFMPYVTETVWGLKNKDLLINASWPES
jgi:valyl-tRNA synthetase